MCGSRKNPLHGRSLEIPRERGVLKAKFLEEIYESKLKFPGGRGVQNKKPSMGVWIFSGPAQYILQVHAFANFLCDFCRESSTTPRPSSC